MGMVSNPRWGPFAQLSIYDNGKGEHPPKVLPLAIYKTFSNVLTQRITTYSKSAHKSSTAHNRI